MPGVVGRTVDSGTIGKRPAAFRDAKSPGPSDLPAADARFVANALDDVMASPRHPLLPDRLAAGKQN